MSKSRHGRNRSPRVIFKQGSVGASVFFVAQTLLVLVPLALSNSVYTKYALPKFVVLLIGSSLLVLLLGLERRTSPPAGDAPLGLLRSNLVRTVCLCFLTLVLSTAFGVNPIGSLFGSSFNYMGLLTHACILIVFIALIREANASEKRLRIILLTISATGFLVAIYAVAQSFGFEPFVPRSTYTFASPTGPLIRVCSTLGHSDYLGNFLLYTTLTTAALGLAERGVAQALAIGATGVSVAAIAFSGTRGSWIGMVTGVVVFAILELKKPAASAFLTRRRLIFAVVSVLVLVGLVASSPASRSATARARLLMNEGLSSSGRVLLWRDSIKMVPAFPIIGCGPEAFRTTFLAFKSKELARLSPKANNESPHSAYLSAAISSGLAGLVLYVAVIVLALAYMLRARRLAQEDSVRIAMTGTVSSFAAVLAHNIFIFDQIATALYFFAFLAVAQVSKTVAEARAGEPKSVRTRGRSGDILPIEVKTSAPQIQRTPRRRLVVVVGVVCVVASIWYSAGLVSSETAYKDLLNPANPVDYDGLVKLGDRVTSSPLPTGAYDYLFARAVDGFVRKLSVNHQAGSVVDVNTVQAQALKLAIGHVEKSLADTFTPEMNYSLLGALALAAGDVNKLRSAAIAAVSADPNNYYTRWLMAEAYLVSGERERAALEAEIALDLYPASFEAASTLARARGSNPSDDSAALEALAQARNAKPKRSAAELIEVGRKLAQAGRLKKARIKLLTAIGRANGPCADCHRELALIYETMGRYLDAIDEWEKYVKEAPERASAEQTEARLEALRKKSDPAR